MVRCEGERSNSRKLEAKRPLSIWQREGRKGCWILTNRQRHRRSWRWDEEEARRRRSGRRRRFATEPNLFEASASKSAWWTLGLRWRYGYRVFLICAAFTCNGGGDAQDGVGIRWVDDAALLLWQVYEVPTKGSNCPATCAMRQLAAVTAGGGGMLLEPDRPDPSAGVRTTTAADVRSSGGGQ